MSGGDLVLLGVLLIVAAHLSAKAEVVLGHLSGRGVRGSERLGALLLILGGGFAFGVGVTKVLP